jgi:glycosyltransferase involved in cell wall biosynthesis
LIDEDFLGWSTRWRMAADHLERLAPCIYLPNYDYDYSGVCPVLSERIRVVGIAHSDDPLHYEHLARIGHSCDAIIGVSKAITRHLGGLLPQMAPRMHTIPYGIPLGQTPRATPRAPRHTGGPLKIVFAGRLVRLQKRVDDILKIARELDRRGVDFELAVVGDGEMRGEMEQASRDLIIRRKIWFALAQPNEGVLSLLAGSHAFLLPSSFEGLSVGMLEAMSQGAVPVVSDIRSGVPDVIRSGENGLIAPVGDIVRFADHLEWLWKNPGECHQLGVAAEQTVRQGFDVDTMVERYIEIFESILKNPLPRPCGPMAPPLHLKNELTFSSWVSRVASDPMASLQRVFDRIRHTVK